MLGKNGSAIKVIPALSQIVRASGSTNGSNFAGFELGTIIAIGASVGSALNLAMQRSGTSDGTYGAFGASLATISAGSGNTYVRSFTIDSSATWYRLVYDKAGAQEADVKVLVILAGARSEPVNQHGNVTVYSDVLGG